MRTYSQKKLLEILYEEISTLLHTIFRQFSHSRYCLEFEIKTKDNREIGKKERLNILGRL